MGLRFRATRGFGGQELVLPIELDVIFPESQRPVAERELVRRQELNRLYSDSITWELVSCACWGVFPETQFEGHASPVRSKLWFAAVNLDQPTPYSMLHPLGLYDRESDAEQHATDLETAALTAMLILNPIPPGDPRSST